MGQRKTWSKEEENIILSNYPDFFEIAKKLPDRTSSAISQHINKMGLSLRNRRWKAVEDTIMRNEYHSGNTDEIANKLKRSKSSIILRARHLKLKKNNSVYRKTNCERLLDGSLRSMYWIGFILADGHITANHRLKIALSVNDKQHLENFASYINTNVYVKPYGKNPFGVEGEQCYMSAKDIDNIKKLVEIYEIRKNKTETPPNFENYNLTQQQWLSLIVGFIDGDGSITMLNRSSSPFNIRLKNHKSWLRNLDFFAKTLINSFDVNSNMKCKLNSLGYSTFTISDSRIVIGLKQFILSNGLIVLDRKWDKIPTTYETKRKRISANNIKHIERLIASGTRINKSELARQFGVSITAITSAINKLFG